MCETVPPPLSDADARVVCQSDTMRSGRGYGSGRSTTPYTTLKIAVVAPAPSASVSTATVVKLGWRNSERIATRRSVRK